VHEAEAHASLERRRPAARVRTVLTHVVWDWNGTLLDDLHACVQVTGTLLREFGLPGLTGVADYQAKFRFPIVDYYALLGFDTAPEGNFQAAAERYMELYGAASPACILHEGALDALAAVRRAGLRQVLISASQQDNLLAQVAPFGLAELLDGFHGIDDIYAASKESLARRWLDGERLAGDRVLFVGDSEHDFEIATALGAHCVLFSGGHHARAHLESLGAPVIDDLREVAAIVAGL
jgi:phosphoglycolate phosphatase